jgi:hypothetical protein
MFFGNVITAPAGRTNMMLRRLDREGALVLAVGWLVALVVTLT